MMVSLAPNVCAHRTAYWQLSFLAAALPECAGPDLGRMLTSQGWCFYSPKHSFLCQGHWPTDNINLSLISTEPADFNRTTCLLKSHTGTEILEVNSEREIGNVAVAISR